MRPQICPAKVLRSISVSAQGPSVLRWHFENLISILQLGLKCQKCVLYLLSKDYFILWSIIRSTELDFYFFCVCWIRGTNRTLCVVVGSLPAKGTQLWGFIRLYSSWSAHLTTMDVSLTTWTHGTSCPFLKDIKVCGVPDLNLIG